jgi:hypothetical protein
VPRPFPPRVVKVETKTKVMKMYKFLVCKKIYADVFVEAETKDEATESLLAMKEWHFNWDSLDDADMTIEECEEVIDDGE